MSERDPRVGRLMLFILAFAAVGTPLFAFLWEVLNDLMNGHVRPLELLLAIPAAAAFALLLRYLARRVQRVAAPVDGEPFPTRDGR